MVSSAVFVLELKGNTVKCRNSPRYCMEQHFPICHCENGKAENVYVRVRRPATELQISFGGKVGCAYKV